MASKAVAYSSAIEVERLLRDSGMYWASAAEEIDNPGWLNRALHAIWQCAYHREFVHVNDVRGAFVEPPVHANAWGSVWKKALKLGWIVPDHTQPLRKSNVPRQHATQGPIYRSLIWHGW